MKGFNYSSNGRTLEVFLPLGLSRIFQDDLRKLMNSGSSFDRVVKALAIFSFQTNQECIFLRDLVRILGISREEVTHVLAREIPHRKAEVLSHLSAICCELVEMGKYAIDADEQQDYLSPNLPDGAYMFFCDRLVSHVLEFQLESEYTILEQTYEKLLAEGLAEKSEV